MKQIVLLFSIIINVQTFSQEKKEHHGDIDYNNITEIKGLIYTKTDTSLITGKVIRFNRKGDVKRYINVTKGKPDINGWIDLNNNFTMPKESDLGEVLKLGAGVAGLAMAISGNDIKTPNPNNRNGYNNEITRDYLDYNNSIVEKSYREASNRNDVTLNYKSQNAKNSRRIVEYDKSGNLLNRQSVVKGRENGRWEAYHLNGNLKSSGFYKNGVEDGLWEEYYDNGELRSLGNYLNGKKEGIWKEYHNNGHLENKAHYVVGKKDGLTESYHVDGQLLGRINFKDGRENGLMEAYHTNGQLMIIGLFKDAKQTGEWKYYDEKGELIKTENHEN